uniref:Uncharacterized protein n=1 Tax=Oryza sativa subsp. japonica TaxID=39947 RepID=Q6H8C8_ORYSJ|nr:hypothetical protein [Oryza sativa Japonica Group]
MEAAAATAPSDPLRQIRREGKRQWGRREEPSPPPDLAGRVAAVSGLADGRRRDGRWRDSSKMTNHVTAMMVDLKRFGPLSCQVITLHLVGRSRVAFLLESVSGEIRDSAFVSPDGIRRYRRGIAMPIPEIDIRRRVLAYVDFYVVASMSIVLGVDPVDCLVVDVPLSS